jgi:hypothetical protein
VRSSAVHDSQSLLLVHAERSFARPLFVTPFPVVDGSTDTHNMPGVFFRLSFENRHLHSLPSYHRHRLEIVTKSVTISGGLVIFEASGLKGNGKMTQQHPLATLFSTGCNESTAWK